MNHMNDFGETIRDCPVCGCFRVSIRGKRPRNTPRRVVCPTCMADALEAVREDREPNSVNAQTERSPK